MSPDGIENIYSRSIALRKENSLSLQYNKLMHQEIEIKIFLDYYKRFLLDIIEHCARKKETEMTPSDFSYKDFSIEELAAITEEINSWDD